MELKNSFHVASPVGRTWEILTDVERVAPCMPGASLTEVRGDEYLGTVKVRLGPVTVQFRGSASFTELDAAGHRAVLRASGRETRGQGNASAAVTVHLVPDGDGTRVDVVTDLTITGKVAQFGRGVLAEVSGKLVDAFAANLAETVVGPLRTDELAPATDPVTPSVTPRAAPVAEPLDLLGGLAGPVARRLVPALVVVALAGLVLRWVGRRTG